MGESGQLGAIGAGWIRWEEIVDVLTLGRADVERLLDRDALLDALADAFAALSDGSVDASSRRRSRRGRSRLGVGGHGWSGHGLMGSLPARDAEWPRR